jgi:hypothetical protein
MHAWMDSGTKFVTPKIPIETSDWLRSFRLFFEKMVKTTPQAFATFLCLTNQVVASFADAITGPFQVGQKIYNSTDERTEFQSKISVWYPTNVVNQTRFISYAHGMMGGGIDVYGYEQLFRSMASFGYVIAATHACNAGCYDHDGVSTCVSLENDPPCFGEYYLEQLQTITWAKSLKDDDAIFANVDWSGGVGIAGHSMGGQATLFSSSYNNASDYDIRAAVMHHPYTHAYPSPQVPYIVFTGTDDTAAPPEMAQPIYEVDGGSEVRGIVNKVGANHLEPVLLHTQYLAAYTAAWFKVYLDKTPQAYGIDFYNMLFGDDDSSLCGGGDGDMAECTLVQ